MSVSIWNSLFKLLGISSTTAIILLVAGIAALTAEKLRPQQVDQTLGGKLRNLGFISLYFVVGGALISLVSYLPAPRLTVQAAASPAQWWLNYFALLFIWDLSYYWYHRAQHASRWLWPIHELHHSDAELNITSALRTHPLERPIQFLIILHITALLLRVDQSAAIWAGTTAIVWSALSHSNLRLSFGPFSRIVCGPQVHRMHHSIKSEHHNSNFAQIFTLIDVVFGTYCPPPKSGQFPQTGVEEFASDESMLKGLLRPFVLWRGLLRKGPGKAPSPK